uniref:SH3 domain-containing protein 19-like n=1 Tax=Doryrhamphus excisus TaxID=161450 RepID=UPI0025AE74C6|nr:SH3 domain-containing protein 19-like [Doryrhamphus excisus]XP_057921634.1 SH3 domain-containing protein 19-like [Doryrhamphus excisus]
MAEARPEEEENIRRNNGEQVIRRQPNSTEGRPDRRKPENRLSQGPLWSLKAAIKKTTSRSTSFSETPRDRNRDRDRRGSGARRPDITILSAEPLPSTSWFPPPPPPAAQIWGPTIPPSIQPPPSYDEVLREKTQEEGVRTSSAITSHPAFRTIISTQTDSGSSPEGQESQAEHVKPLRPPLPRTVSQDGISLPLTPASDRGQSEQLPAFDTETPSAKPPLNEVQQPRPLPRSRSSVTPVSNEVKVQTLVKLREDGLATLAARANANISKQDVIQGKYFQELLEAFSTDDWGFPECPGDDSGLSQSEEDENEDEEVKDMATLKARIQAFEQQQQQAGLENEKVGGKKPEPRPRPRLQGPCAKVLPPTIAPKPKILLNAPQVVDTLSTQGTPEKLNAQPVPESVPPTPAPIPAPRLPPAKFTPSPSETPSTGEDPSKLPVPMRIVPPPHDRAPVVGGNVTPTRPPRPSMQVNRGSQTTNTLKLTGPTPEPTAFVHAKSPPKSEISQPSLPPRPSSVKSLPPRPPPMKSVPARPPPPASVSSVSQSMQAPSNQVQGQRASKKGPPLPPRPNAGHPLFNSYMPATHSKDTDNKHESQKQDVLIILDDPPPAHHLMDLQMLPQSELSKPTLGSVKPSEWPTMQKHPEPPHISGPRCVALFDFEGMQDDELTFSQGDVISLLEIIGTEWGRGQIAGRVGLFPLIFTRVTEPLPPEGTAKPPLAREMVIENPAAPQSTKDTQVEEWVVALFDFSAQTAEDLPFHKGALIQVTQHVDSEWRRGRLDGREGLYPAAFTQACQAQPIEKQQEATRGVAKALFAFTAKNEDELTVKAGDIITLVEPVDEQWIVGVVGGRRGMVPRNYICLL